MPDIIPDAMEEDDISYASTHASAPAGLGHGHAFYRTYRSSSATVGGRSCNSNHSAISLPNRFHHFLGGNGGRHGGSSTASTTTSRSGEGDIQLKRDREREGRCSECGAQTHEWRVVGGVPTKIPLYVENEVHRGRCLLCHPLTFAKSQRSIHTVSSCGQSVHSEPTMMSMGHPDWVESSAISVSTTRSAVDEAMSVFDAETADLCDVIAAMRRHPSEVRIQERGCEKLWIQSWDDENSAAIGRVGGISTILGAMRYFPENQHLQQCGCESLQNLANNEYNCDVICEQGGIDIVVAAMNHHINNAGIQQCGCSALANLAGTEQRIVAIGQQGGLHAILKAAQYYADEESVASTAHQALRALGVDPNRVQQALVPQARPPPPPQPIQPAAPPAAIAAHVRSPKVSPLRQRRSSQEHDQVPKQVFRLDQHGFPIMK